MRLEQAGVATVTVISDVFRALAENERKSLGMPDLRLVAIDHPLADNSREAVEGKANLAIAAILGGLVDPPSQPDAVS